MPSKILVAFLWHALGACLLLLIGSLAIDAPFWVPGAGRRTLTILVMGYLATAVVSTTALVRDATPRRFATPALGIFVFVFFWLLVSPSPYSREAIASTVPLAMTLVFGGTRVHRFWRLGIQLLFIMVSGVAVRNLIVRLRPNPTVTREVARTGFTNVVVTQHSGYIDNVRVMGGGVTRLGDGVLLATGDGRVFHVDWPMNDESLVAAPLDLRIPLNAAAFSEAASEGIRTNDFRATGILAQETVDGVRLFASHHYWNTEERCYVLRVSTLTSSVETLLAEGAQASWEPLFDSKPCLPLETARGPFFAGNLSGGKMAMLDTDTLLLSVGDHGYDGWNTDEALSQNPSTSYGKTVRIRLPGGDDDVFTVGHRNPQGLHVDANGHVWLTEHGPQGGDELNLVEHGQNYGWPWVTYGTNYGSVVWPLNENQGEHLGFVSPVFSWVPSIGITSVIRVEQPRFPTWRGDLLVGSLAGTTVFRVRIRQGRVVFVEPIPIGRRVRDFVETSSGRIVLWLDGGIVGLLEAAPLDGGEMLFLTRCGGCHGDGSGPSAGIGPDLNGIVGGAMGTASGFHYSDAFKEQDARWSERRLDAFLADPVGQVPGTSMRTGAVENPVERAAIIEHLKTLH